jgi:DNA-binding response OmpR family regulator
MLITEDEALARRMAWVLEEEGFAVIPVAHPEEAVPHLEPGRPDVIVMNTDLPAAEKQARIESLRDILPDVGLIDLSRKSRRPSQNTGADEYVNTPFDADELVEKVRRTLDDE